jgi:Protein of unknown function (DUF2946)
VRGSIRLASVEAGRGRPGTGRIKSMSWLRSNIQSGTWLALLALTLQMAVSFGHMHRHDLGLLPLIKAGQTQTLTDEATAPADSDDQDHHSAPDHYCPICASIALVGTGAPALAPVLVTPTSVVRLSPPEKPAYLQHPQFTVSFQARGPPSI